MHVLQEEFNLLQKKLQSHCEYIAKECGLEPSDISYKFIEDDVFKSFDIKLYITAPCGCCGMYPYVDISDEYKVFKLKKLKEIEKIIRSSSDDFSWSMDIWLDDIEDWNESSETIAKRFLNEWNLENME